MKVMVLLEKHLRQLHFDVTQEELDIDLAQSECNGACNQTLLIRAAQSGNSNAVAVLMLFAQEHALVNYIYHLDQQGFSALHWAIHSGHAATVAVMQYLDPLVLMQRTGSGILANRLLPPRGKRRILMSAYLAQSENNNFAKMKRKHLSHFLTGKMRLSERFLAVFTVDFFCFYSLLLSLLLSMVIELALLVIEVDRVTRWSNYFLQFLIWYFYLNTIFCEKKDLPISCIEMYPIALGKMYLLCCSDSQLNEECTSSDAPGTIGDSLCHFCGAVRPHHSFHCFHSNKCLSELDHYCVFLKTSIYQDNYFWFFGFLISMVVAMPWFLVSVYKHQESLEVIFPPVLLVSFYYWTLLIWMLILLFVSFHLYLLSIGVTMHEYSLSAESYTPLRINNGISWQKRLQGASVIFNCRALSPMARRILNAIGFFACLNKGSSADGTVEEISPLQEEFENDLQYANLLDKHSSQAMQLRLGSFLNCKAIQLPETAADII